MELLKQLNEASTTIELVQQICEAITKSAQFFKDRGNVNRFLLRGTDDHKELVALLEPRKDRRPTDSNIHAHNAMNKAFIDLFGFPYRSAALFTTPDSSSAGQYGPVSIILPVGPYDICWSEQSSDALHLTSGRRFRKWALQNGPEDIVQALEIHTADSATLINNEVAKILDTNPKVAAYHDKWVENQIKEAGYVTGHLQAALKDQHEIMLKCAQYYAISRFSVTPGMLAVARKIVSDQSFLEDANGVLAGDFITALAKKLV